MFSRCRWGAVLILLVMFVPTLSLAETFHGVYFVGDKGVNLSSAFNLCQFNEDSESGCAILVNPGTYTDASADMNMGYFTEVMGIGNQRKVTQMNPVTIVSPDVGADTRTFWRSLENVTITGKQTWNVSQGTDLRRVHVEGDLDLFNPNNPTAWVSGGLMADSTVDGTVDSGRQQQWFSRNTTFTHWTSSDGGDNGVFVNTAGDIDQSTFNGHYESVDLSDPTASDNPNSVQGVTQKPYLVCQSEGECYDFSNMVIRVPNTDVSQYEGDVTDTAQDQFTDIGAENFCVVDTSWTPSAIQSCMDTQQAMILLPGVYQGHFTIQQKGFVLLGLGYPRMQTDQPGSDGVPGQSAVNVLNNNVTVAGVMWEDANVSSRTLNTSLLKLGASKGDGLSDGAHLYDVLVRLTTDQYACATDPFGFYPSIEVYGSDVMGDNLWLWAKDSDGSQQSWAANGLEINGDRDVMFGLAVEHFYGYQTQWNGDKGSNYFYQSELPYFMTAPNGVDLPTTGLSPSMTVEGNHFYGAGLGVYSVVPWAYTGAAIQLSGSDSRLNMAFIWDNGDSSFGNFTDGHILHVGNDWGDNYLLGDDVEGDKSYLSHFQSS